jgi:D-amino-acid oxidase
MPDYTEIQSREIPFGYTHGCKYTSITVDVPVYLNYLYQRTKLNDVTIIQETLPTSSFHDALARAKEVVFQKFTGSNKENVAAYVNATGISAKRLVPDDGIFPIRGQTVVVEGVSKRLTTTHFETAGLGPTDPQITYIIPRAASQTTVLGGTKQVGNWDSLPNEETTRKIIENAKQFAPELLDDKGEFKVLEVKVGLRPGRKGGPRIEVERVGDYTVCHAYGNAGGGLFNRMIISRLTFQDIKIPLALLQQW